MGETEGGLFSGELQWPDGGSGTEETVPAAGEAPGVAKDAGGGDGGGRRRRGRRRRAKAASEAPEVAGQTGAQFLRLDWIQSHVRCIDLPGNPLPLVFCS